VLNAITDPNATCGRRERPIKGVGGVATQRDAARRGVLDDHARDPRVFARPPRRHGHQRRVDVQEIVERQLLTVELLQVANTRLVSHVERGPLVEGSRRSATPAGAEHETQGRWQRLLRA